MKLYLDSTDNKKIILKIDDKEYSKEVNSPREQNVFGFLIDCLEKNGQKIQDITEVEVNPGPGSFTGTRIGVTIANALAFAQNIKVNGQLPPIEPVYSAPPSITTTSKKD
jgi:tRNA threonylcarbamoyladenosine biosynthesis protein TsaB